MNLELLKTGPYIPILIFLVVDIVCSLMWEDYSYGIYDEPRKKRQDIILWLGGLSMLLDYVGVCTGFTSLQTPATVFMRIIGAILVLRIVGVHWIYENRRDMTELNRIFKETSERCYSMSKMYTITAEEIDHKMHQLNELLKRTSTTEPVSATEDTRASTDNVDEPADETGFRMTANGRTITFLAPFPVQHPERVFLVPNGIWQNVKLRFPDMVKSIQGQKKLGGITVIPIYAMDIFAEDSFHQLKRTSDDPFKTRLSITCYSWNPILNLWDTRAFSITSSTPDVNKMEMSACLTQWLVDNGAKYGFHNFTQVYRQYVQMVQNAQGTTFCSEVRDEPAGEKLEEEYDPQRAARLGAEYRPTLDASNKIDFGLSNATIMHINQLTRILLPAAQYLLQTTPMSPECVQRIFSKYQYIEVDEYNTPIINLDSNLVTTPSGISGVPTDHDMYYDAGTDADIGTFNVFTFHNSDTDIWYMQESRAIHLTTKNAVSVAAVREQIMRDMADVIDPVHITKVLDEFVEYLPCLSLDHIPADKPWRSQCITESAFRCIKANTEMKTLHKNAFVTEDGTGITFNSKYEWEPIFNFLRNRDWVIIADDAVAISFDLTNSTIRYTHKGEVIRIAAFRVARMDDNGRWIEKWCPFYYKVGTLDGDSLQVAITQYSKFTTDWFPAVVRKTKDLIEQCGKIWNK